MTWTVSFVFWRPRGSCGRAKRSDKDNDIYMKTVNEVKLFLMGEKKDLLSSLHDRMTSLSREQRYEEAAQVRDTLNNIERAWETQRVIAPERSMFV